MDPVIKAKYIQLCATLKQQNNIAIAFSGGVDSTLLLHLACDSIKNDEVVAITMTSSFYPKWELEYARRVVTQLKVKHKVISIDPLAIDEIANNPPDRCYTCKKVAFTLMQEYANSIGIDYICDGSCYDDLQDYRPGFRAVQELGIHSPFIDYELNKSTISALSRELNIAGWSRPSCACLASRIPYHEPITVDKLKIVESAEDFLHKFDLPEARVRLHDKIARIEVFIDNINQVIANREQISDYIKSLGVSYVAVELDGYKTGSLNKGLSVGNSNE